ncbi:unnamed protein product [Bursaphelenchus xylophilus]|nr:unnamed protein product [Bursaphelenchus xylophilus]CAG9087903.1 unnamed protein product [Bursaphelenchus xylophilus]
MRNLLFLSLLGLATAQTFTPHLEDHEQLPEEAKSLTGQALVDYINNLKTSWSASADHKFKSASNEEIKPYLGLIDMPVEYDKLLGEQPVHAEDDLPVEFDAREKWPNCKSLSVIRDQSHCGSCWAVAAAGAISDRICIHSNGEKQVEISAVDLLSCCKLCGMGCFGGAPEAAWVFFELRGLVSGGEYGDKSTCRPYPFEPCEHHIDGPKKPCGSISPTPKCEKQCQSGYQADFKQDIHKGKLSFPVKFGEHAIKAEIYNNGPVEAGFSVFEDFVHYKSGVYQHKAGGFLGGHAVKVLGWGVENNTNYWLVANSWNEDWGDKGYFKILRGHNHCGIETRVSAGIPKDD